MDPITVVVLGGIGITAAIKLGPIAVSAIIAKVSDSRKKAKKRKQMARKRDPKVRAELARSNKLQRQLEKFRTMDFTGITNNIKKRVSIQEINEFDKENDIILRGILTLKDGNANIVKQEVIYLFQPRVLSSNGIPIGPKLDKNGNLLDKNSYLIKVPGDEEIYRGYMPKRECLSNEQFEFINGSVHTTTKLLPFLSIDIPKDEKGNFIPVNKNNTKEMQEFEDYIKQKEAQRINAGEYVNDIMDRAADAKEKWDYDHRPRYAKGMKEVDERKAQRVEKARESRAKREAQTSQYYDRLSSAAMMQHALYDHGVRNPMTGPGPRSMGGAPGGPMGGMPLPPPPPPSGGRGLH